MYPGVELLEGDNSEGRCIQSGQEFNDLDYELSSSPEEPNHSASCSNEYGSSFPEDEPQWFLDSTQFSDTQYSVYSEAISTGTDITSDPVNSPDSTVDQLLDFEFLQAFESSGFTSFQSSPFNGVVTMSTGQFGPVGPKIASPLAFDPQATPVTFYEPWSNGQAEVYSPMYQEPSNRTTPELSTAQSPAATVTQPVTPTDQVIPRFRCQVCRKVFDKSNDLKRHEGIHFPETGRHFICKCGHSNKRKDNYKRHVMTCQKPEIDHSFRCICDLPHTDKDSHLGHIKNCKAAFHGNAGRPARIAPR